MRDLLDRSHPRQCQRRSARDFSGESAGDGNDSHKRDKGEKRRNPQCRYSRVLRVHGRMLAGSGLGEVPKANLWITSVTSKPGISTGRRYSKGWPEHYIGRKMVQSRALACDHGAPETGFASYFLFPGELYS